MSNLTEILHTHQYRAGVMLWLLILILVPTGGLTRVPARATGVSAEPARVMEGYGKLPLAFEPNQGQTDRQVKFLSRGAGYSLFLTNNGAVLTLGKVSRHGAAGLPAASSPVGNEAARQETPSVLRMKLLGASAKAEVRGQDELPGRSSYFLGNDPKNWHTRVPQYAKVRYESIYPGIDLVYYGKQRELEYDFVVQPGADPNVIRLGMEGARGVRLEHGDLVLTSAAGDVSLRRPHMYQQVNGVRHEIAGGYVLKGNNEVRFCISNYDPTLTLVIDPILAYSSYLGGRGSDASNSIAVDSAGNAYLTGYTSSIDFPTVNALQPSYVGGLDAFVTKINADGTALVYSTYLGGSRYNWGNAIAVDPAGNAYVTGYTNSTDFPTVNAIQSANGGVFDAYVSKINASGSALVYSTYLGGSGNDWGTAIAVDSAGKAYVTGYTSSTDLPTVNAIQPTNHGYDNAFVSKINASGSALVYSTYLGGDGYDSGWAIAVDRFGSAYVVGNTDSPDFPTVNAIQPANHGGGDAFITKINASGSAMAYSTYVGGTEGEWGSGIAVDLAGNAYMIGGTGSADFPTVNAIQPANHGAADAFVAKINASGTAFAYSTYLGGTWSESGNGIAVDLAGNAYVTGFTDSTDFPTVNAIQASYGGSRDAFVTKINASGTALIYSTYIGGGGRDEGNAIAVDSWGSVYATGMTLSARSFPHTVFAFQQSLNGADAFVSKIASHTFVSISHPEASNFGTVLIGNPSVPKQVTLTNQGSGALTIHRIFIGGVNGSEFAETNNCPASLSAGGVCTVAVTFTPAGANKRKGVLGISDSDPASPQAIVLSGNGTVVGLSATALRFGRQSTGTSSAPQIVTLTNMGSTQLNFSGITITGDAGSYSQTSTCGTSMAAGANCTVTVRFAPRTTGLQTAAVSISDDGGGSPQRIVLSGTGI